MTIRSLIALTLFAAAGALQAQTVDVRDAWARATVPGQKASGAFMTLIATQNTRLVGVSSPVAGVAELHEMTMEGDVMKMRAITGLDLPAGRAVELRPGGYHLMLMNLKTALRPDQRIPVTLQFKNAQGQDSRLELQVPVRAMGAASAPAGPSGGQHGHGGHH
jgi:copper(I)-binding protein